METVYEAGSEGFSEQDSGCRDADLALRGTRAISRYQVARSRLSAGPAGQCMRRCFVRQRAVVTASCGSQKARAAERDGASCVGGLVAQNAAMASSAKAAAPDGHDLACSSALAAVADMLRGQNDCSWCSTGIVGE